VCVCVCSPWTGPSGGIGPLFLWKLPPRSGLFFSQRTLKTRSKVQRVCRADLGRVSRSVSLSMAGDRWVVCVFRGSLSSAIGSGSVWACYGEVQLWALTLALGYTHTHTAVFLLVLLRETLAVSLLPRSFWIQPMFSVGSDLKHWQECVFQSISNTVC